MIHSEGESFVRRSHTRAIKLAQRAFVARETGHPERAKTLSKAAFIHELHAAMGIPSSHPDCEPTRSILFRSAASLAFNAGEFTSAFGLAQEGLSATTPKRIRHELLTLQQDTATKLQV